MPDTSEGVPGRKPCPLRGNDEVARRTRVLMWQHEQERAEKARVTVGVVEDPRAQAVFAELRGILADPWLTDRLKIKEFRQILGGAA